MLLIEETQSDITFVISVKSHFAKNPNHFFTKAIKTIFKYLKITKDRDIFYKQGVLSRLRDIQIQTRQVTKT